MASGQDYRSEKMESREGLGLAQERRRRWEDSIPADVLDAVYGGQNSRDTVERLIGKEAADHMRKRWQSEVKERSDLIGFWVSWHLAGGFSALEEGGWNRATLFRKVKRFRTVFGAHPDEYTFDYLSLDPPKAWWADLRGELGAN